MMVSEETCLCGEEFIDYFYFYSLVHVALSEIWRYYFHPSGAISSAAEKIMPRAPATDNNNIVILHLSLERYLIDHPSSIATHTLPHDNPTADNIPPPPVTNDNNKSPPAMHPPPALAVPRALRLLLLLLLLR
jgi:hypothetical protein